MTTEARPRTCGDCGAKPGGEHADGCDVARCLVTGLQRLQCCEDRDCGRAVWTGAWPGDAECTEFGWRKPVPEAEKKWLRANGIPFEDPRLDLNRLHPYRGEVTWDRRACRWRRPADPVDDTFYVHWHLDRGLALEPSAWYTVDGVTLPAGELLARMGRAP